MRRIRQLTALAAAAALPVLAGCAGKTTAYPIHHRQFAYDDTRLAEDYSIEYKYVRERRKELATPARIEAEYKSDCQKDGCKWCPPVLNSAEVPEASEYLPGRWMKIRVEGKDDVTCFGPVGDDCEWCEQQRVSLENRADPAAWHQRLEPLTGLALSGGGIRSATFNLGVLQALDAQHTLPYVDYMSSVSGGSYIAGWMQAHLGANQHGSFRDEVYYQIGATNSHDLLWNNGDNVEQLRTHAQFLNKGRYAEGPILVWSYLWRWPLALLTDVILHIKGNYNEFHPITIYQDRLEVTYFRGTPPANVSTPAKSELELTALNGASFPTPYLIINGNLVNHGTPRGQGDARDQFNFEFTRDFTGSDGLGYIPSEAFDRSVEEVDMDGAGRPVEVHVSGDELDGSSFRLSQAVAASGAAFDPDGFITRVPNQWVRTPAGYAASLVNLNLGYETWNYARGYDGPFWTPVDYARMQTYQRVLEPETDARWIEITDGGHYENLGVLSLARRGVSCIIAIDASADRHWEFDDLKILKKRLCEHGLDLTLTAELLETARREGHVRLDITERGKATPVAHILYIKPNADPVELAYPKPMEDPRPHHLETTYLKGGTGYPKADDTIDKIRKIKWYQQNRASTTFPHTSTFLLSYDWETFEAYRLLGFQMARTYLPNGADLNECEFKQRGEE